MAFPLDKNGVPVCSREDIEQKAEDVINYISPGTLTRPSLTPLATIARELNKKFKVFFDFEQDLGTTKKGNKILGKFVTQPRAIFVDKSLDYNDPRWSFTLAHELGHFVLHRKVRVELGTEQYSTFSDTLEQMVALMAEKSWSPHQWLEWQANSFASSLLMPRTTFRSKFMDVIASTGHTRNRPFVYLDHQPENIKFAHTVKYALMECFGTSSSATKVRMCELQLLIDATPHSTRHIIEFLREE